MVRSFTGLSCCRIRSTQPSNGIRDFAGSLPLLVYGVECRQSDESHQMDLTDIALEDACEQAQEEGPQDRQEVSCPQPGIHDVPGRGSPAWEGTACGDVRRYVIQEDTRRNGQGWLR